ncbi:MAG: ligase-associated DNA damage response endonuclease PdeM [Pseudomonadota bacterium]|nr:ligase-associated DNA damage response endonuclease PdeM [Pseudomonadota bacterium]
MPVDMAVEIAGASVELHAQRAVYWPARRRLLIADLHLGKADAFRRAGIGVPRGGTTHDLERLSQLLLSTEARELWVLGDMLHGAVLDSPWRRTWHAWRERHAGVEIAVITGNHDRAIAGAALGIRLLGDSHDEPPFALRHEPQWHPHLHVISGHIHPQVALPGMRRRWPAFWLRDGMTVLPAFSAFTAGVVVSPAGGEVMAICAESEMVLLNGPLPIPGPAP